MNLELHPEKFDKHKRLKVKTPVSEGIYLNSIEYSNKPYRFAWDHGNVTIGSLATQLEQIVRPVR